MQKKIFNSTILLLLIILVVLGIAAMGIGYSTYCRNAYRELEISVSLAYDEKLTPQQVHERIKKSAEDIRLVALNSDSKIVFDSGDGENALPVGSLPDSGKSALITKMSGIWKDTCVYCIEQNDVLLVGCKEVSSIFFILASAVPFIVLALGFLVVGVNVFSLKLSERLVAPVKKLVSKIDIFTDKEELHTEYEELEPVVRAVTKLSVRLERYIKRLKKERETLELITGNMVEGMLMLDSKNDIILVNKSAVNMLNPEFKQGEKRNLIELTRNIKLIKAIDSMSEQSSNVHESIEQNGRYLRAFINRVELENDDFGFIVLLVDATERIRAEEIRRDFSANVSHELKTPLTTIKGFGEMFENGMLNGDENVRKYGGMIKRESERLIFLINDIIRLSEIEEKSEKHMTTLELSSIVESAADILRESAAKNNISIDVKSEKLTLMGNESYLRELFINLIDNAVKYNINGGRVSISAFKDKNEAVIIVEDNGIGISPQDQGRIFERFYRADKSHSRKIGGTGLGLSIVKHIVSYHNGHLELESALNRGTKITVKLPL